MHNRPSREYPYRHHWTCISDIYFNGCQIYFGLFNPNFYIAYGLHSSLVFALQNIFAHIYIACVFIKIVLYEDIKMHAWSFSIISSYLKKFCNWSNSWVFVLTEGSHLYVLAFVLFPFLFLFAFIAAFWPGGM